VRLRVLFKTHICLPEEYCSILIPNMERMLKA